METQKHFLHPNYTSTTYYYDIGLIKLSESYTSNTEKDYHPSPICLPPRNFSINKRYGMMSGWGGHIYPGGDLYIGPVAMNEGKDDIDEHPFPYLEYRQIFESKTCRVNYAELLNILQNILIIFLTG